MFFLVDDLGGLYIGTELDERVRLVTDFDIEFTDIASFGGTTLVATSSDTLYEISLVDFSINDGTPLSVTGAEALDFTLDTDGDDSFDGELLIGGTGDTNLSTVDPDGTVTAIGDVMANAEGDIIFAADLAWMTTTDQTIIAIDPETGEIVGSGEHGIDGLEGLAAVGDEIVGFAENLIYSFDPATFEFTFRSEIVDDLDNPISDVVGAAYVPAVPGFDPVALEDAQSVALLYEAALDRDGDAPGASFWIRQFRDGLSLEEISQEFLDSPEFEDVFGDPDSLSDQELVETFYQNILDRPGEQEGVDFWTAAVGDESFDRNELLLAFSESPENRQFSDNDDDLVQVGVQDWNFVA